MYLDSENVTIPKMPMDFLQQLLNPLLGVMDQELPEEIIEEAVSLANQKARSFPFSCRVFLDTKLDEHFDDVDIVTISLGGGYFY